MLFDALDASGNGIARLRDLDVFGGFSKPIALGDKGDQEPGIKIEYPEPGPAAHARHCPEGLLFVHLEVVRTGSCVGLELNLDIGSRRACTFGFNKQEHKLPRRMAVFDCRVKCLVKGLQHQARDRCHVKSSSNPQSNNTGPTSACYNYPLLAMYLISYHR